MCVSRALNCLHRIEKPGPVETVQACAALLPHHSKKKNELLTVNFFFFLTLPSTFRAAFTDLSRRNRGVVM